MSEPSESDHNAATIVVVALWCFVGGLGWYFLCRDVFAAAFNGAWT